jgi:LCP family protein required for cell wall assembly
LLTIGKLNSKFFFVGYRKVFEMKKTRLNILDICTILAYILTTVIVLLKGFLPTRIIGTILLIGLIILGISLSLRSKILKVLVCIALLIVSSSVIYLKNATTRVIELIPIETTILSFYTTKQSGITKIEETQNKRFGCSENLDTETVAFIRSETDKKLQSYSLTTAIGDVENLKKLENKEIDVLVLNNAMHQNLLEVEPYQVENLVLIWSIEMPNPKEDIVKKVDIEHKPFIILISGIDIAGPINVRSRSDVDILMVVNPITKKILTVSIPRDTYTPLGCRTGGLDKLTDSGIYGIACTVRTIEKLVEVDINYYIRLNFTSLIKLIDVIGNIDVNSKYTFDSAGFHFNAGMNNLNSARSLAFSRERKSFPTGDVQRGLNQQEVIKAIIKKMTTPASILKVEGIIKALRTSVDTNFTSEDLSILIKLQLDTNAKWVIKSSNLSGTGDMLPTYSMGSRLLFVMHPSQSSLNLIRTNIKSYMNVAK